MTRVANSEASLLVPTRWCPACGEFLLEPTAAFGSGHCIGCHYVGPLERPIAVASPRPDHRRHRGPKRRHRGCRRAARRARSTATRPSRAAAIGPVASAAHILALRRATSLRIHDDAGNLERLSKRELYRQAAALEIRGRSKMSKVELIAAIRSRR